MKQTSVAAHTQS